jgi:hypothetical protein
MYHFHSHVTWLLKSEVVASLHFYLYDTMEKQLTSPLLITDLCAPTPLSSKLTYSHLQSFLETLPLGPSRTQLERLNDALGVDTGLILPAEGERREAERSAAKLQAKEERRSKREAERKKLEEEEMDGLEGAVEDDGEAAEDGDVEAVGEGEADMDERGDVEYGDAEEDDEDEPDNEVDVDMDKSDEK